MNSAIPSLLKYTGNLLLQLTSASSDSDFFSSHQVFSGRSKSIELKSKPLGHGLSYLHTREKRSSSTHVSLLRLMGHERPLVRLAMMLESSMDEPVSAIGVTIFPGSGWDGESPEPSSFNIR